MKAKNYLRDGRAPVPKSPNVSRVMSSNKGKNTRPELILRKALFASGLRGYRIHPSHISGRPDIFFGKRRLVIFVNGCFWHRCPHCNLDLPKSHTGFWSKKFQQNCLRDRDKEKILLEAGFSVIVVWECEIYKSLGKIVTKINNNLQCNN